MARPARQRGGKDRLTESKAEGVRDRILASAGSPESDKPEAESSETGLADLAAAILAEASPT